MRMVYLVNGISPSMFPTPCSLIIKKIDLNTAVQVLKNGFQSAIGHQSTAEVLSKLLNINVPTNRVAIKADYGDMLIVFTLNARLPEGKVLDVSEIEKIGYDLYSVIVWNEEWDKYVV